LTGDWPREITDFWFGLDPGQWWNGTPELDHQIRQRFGKLWSEKRELPIETFLPDPLTALAAVILFDQLPRNMFRGHADAYATDVLALAIARQAVDLGFDGELAPDGRKFLYMPFQHSEDLEDQNRSIMLFTKLGDESQLGYARHHREIIERFGRFPHRNHMLGRQSRDAEILAGADKPW
jgi:uncharacterized protein (DUF924 family)